MDTASLRILLRKIINCKYRTFVLSKDQIENISCDFLPCFIILNTEPSHILLGHWIAIIYTNTTIEYFDSFGETLEFYNINLNRNVKIINNSRNFQSMQSLVCGFYSLLYLSLRSKSYPVQYFYSLFTSNKINNDKLVLQFYKKIKTKKYICSYGQKCISKTDFLKSKSCL